MTTDHTGLAPEEDMDVAEDITDALRACSTACGLRRVTTPADAAELPSHPWHGHPHLHIETDAPDADDRREYVLVLHRI